MDHRSRPALWRAGLFVAVAACHVAAIAAIAGSDRLRAPQAEGSSPLVARLIAPPAVPTAPPAPAAKPQDAAVRPVADQPERRAVTGPARPAVAKPTRLARAASPSPPVQAPVPDPSPAPRPVDPPLAMPAQPMAAPGSGPLASVSEATTAVPAAAALLPARFDAAYLSNPPPRYPLAARRLGEQGTVVLTVRVSASGEVSEVTIERSSGSDRLDRAALATVSTWRFEPARRGNMAIAAAVEVPIIFRLEN